MKRYNRFVNENFNSPYVDLISNLYTFFEGKGYDVNIVKINYQSIDIELPFDITRKEEWWKEFIRITEPYGYDVINTTNNKICLSISLGIGKQPDTYISFSD